MAADSRTIDAKLLVDVDHHDTLLVECVSRARVSVWISTANLKELRTEAPIGTRARARGEYVSYLETLDALVAGGVDVRILHASPPSRPFRAALSACKHLSASKLRLCPRVHAKIVIVDGSWLYLGSANFTGAGLGAKAEGRRNFEMGILTSDENMLDRAQAYFDRIYRGRECAGCKLRRVCPRPLDMAPKPLVRARALPVLASPTKKRATSS